MLSPVMASALQAVARMKGDGEPDAAMWAELEADLRCVRLDEADPRQGSKPTGR